MAMKPYIFEPDLESMPREKLEQRQLELLQKLVARCYENVEMYKEKFDEIGLKPSDIRTLDDLRKIPFTTKEDLRKRYPFNGILAVPPEDVIRVHSTSGTTGKPCLSPLTENDKKLEHRLMARIFAATGMTNKDTFQCLWGYGMFLGGLPMGVGSETIGIRHIPTGAAVGSERQLELIEDLKPTMLGGTPSFLSHLTEVAKQKGIDVGKLGVKVLIEGAEACSRKTRESLMKAWNADVYDIGGTCELFHIWHECQEHTGLHLAEDAVIFEVLDPQTNEPVKPGERGELVVTTLLKEAMPLLRWRTRDITSIIDGDGCPCGRTSRKIANLSGRADDGIKVKGVMVYPSQIEEMLKSLPEVKDSEFQLVISRDKMATDVLSVRVEIPDSLAEQATATAKKIEAEIKNKLNITTKLEMVKYGTLPRYTAKAKRIVDERDIGFQQ